MLSKNQEQQQFIVQLLSEYNQNYSDTRKSSIVENMKIGSYSSSKLKTKYFYIIFPSLKFSIFLV